MLKVTVLIENKTYKEGLAAEHGLSLLIEAQGKTILFDAGNSAAFAANAEALGVNLRAVDFAVLSHGHHDHSGGFPAFFHLNQKAPLYVHRTAFGEFYAMKKQGSLEACMCGIRWRMVDEAQEALTAKQPCVSVSRLRFTDAPIWLSEHMLISGTIPRPADAVLSETFFVKEGESYRPDSMEHEQFLVIEEKDGLCLFSGCSHGGIIPAIDYAQTLFPGKHLKLLVAGLHLYGADPALRQAVIDRLADMEIDRILPLHCTGMDAFCQLKSRLEDRCIFLNTGNCFES